MNHHSLLAHQVIEEVQKAVIGKQDCIEKVMMAILSSGHILLELSLIHIYPKSLDYYYVSIQNHLENALAPHGNKKRLLNPNTGYKVLFLTFSHSSGNSPTYKTHSFLPWYNLQILPMKTPPHPSIFPLHTKYALQSVPE